MRKKSGSNKHKYVTYSLVILISIILLESFLYLFTENILKKNIKCLLVEIAVQGANIVEKDIKAKLDMLEMISNVGVINDPQIPTEEKINVLKKDFIKGSIKRIGLVDREGNAVTTDGISLYVGDREYFIKALFGKSNVSDPLISKVDGRMSIVYASPIINNNSVIGVLYIANNVEELCKITDSIRLGKNGNTYMINSSGVKIAHDNRDLVYSKDSTSENFVNDKTLEKLVELEKKMMDGETGAGEYIYNGIRKYMGFAPVKSTGWSIAVTAPKSYIFSEIEKIILFVTIFFAIILCVTIYLRIYTIFLTKNLKQEKTTSTAAIDAANLVMIEIGKDGKIIEFNKHAQQKTGYDIKQAEKLYIQDIVHFEAFEKANELIENIKNNEKVNEFYMPLMNKNRSVVHIIWNSTVNSHKKTYVIIGIDISERFEYETKLYQSHEELTSLYEELAASEEELKQQFDELCRHQELLRTSEERFRLCLEGSNDIIWDWDLIKNTVYFSERWNELLGYDCLYNYSLKDLWPKIVHKDDYIHSIDTIEKLLNKKITIIEDEYRIKTVNGDYKWFFVRGKALYNSYGKAIRVAGSITDITERKEYELKIRKLAYTDSLTGLPNRLRLEKDVNKYIKSGKDFASLIFIDLDNFKFVNDTFGHFFGDSLLQSVAEKILEVTDKCNTVARLGGDEFAVFLTEINNENSIIEYVKKLINVLDMEICKHGILFNISVSIGISIYPFHGQNFEELLKNADTAMYKSKEAGKKRYTVFDKHMNYQLYERMSMESNLRNAIENKELLLYYQPHYDLKKGKILGFEVLVRWDSPIHGFVSPERFISLAEERGIIIPIGNWILKEACNFLNQLYSKGYTNLFISVNVSVYQIMQDNFVEDVLSIINEAGIKKEFIELEITESILMKDIQSIIEKIRLLRENGISIALDDFGTGYSSLTYLKKLPINTLKLEKSFIDDIIKNKESYDITGTIIMLAHTLGLRVIAEGVETKEQMECLMMQGCDLIQGYYISKPLPPEKIEEMLRSEYNA